MSSERDLAEIRLAAWHMVSGQRDQLVKSAITAGVSRRRIVELTGIARTTIDRILGDRPIE